MEWMLYSAPWLESRGHQWQVAHTFIMTYHVPLYRPRELICQDRVGKHAALNWHTTESTPDAPTVNISFLTAHSTVQEIKDSCSSDMGLPHRPDSWGLSMNFENTVWYLSPKHSKCLWLKSLRASAASHHSTSDSTVPPPLCQVFWQRLLCVWFLSSPF